MTLLFRCAETANPQLRPGFIDRRAASSQSYYLTTGTRLRPQAFGSQTRGAGSGSARRSRPGARKGKDPSGSRRIRGRTRVKVAPASEYPERDAHRRERQEELATKQDEEHGRLPGIPARGRAEAVRTPPYHVREGS